MEIKWPSGIRQALHDADLDVDADRIMTIIEPGC